jgi:hypothetical protein
MIVRVEEHDAIQWAAATWHLPCGSTSLQFAVVVSSSYYVTDSIHVCSVKRIKLVV